MPSTNPSKTPKLQTKHYGKVLTDRVKTAEMAIKHDDVSAEYATVRDNMDVLSYMLRRADMFRATKMDLVSHFIRAGSREGRNPTSYFSTSHYLARYPEIQNIEQNSFAHWLDVGRAKGEIVYPIDQFVALAKILGQDPAELQEELIHVHSSVQDRLENGVLGEMVAKAAELDPLIAHSWPAALKVKIAPFHSNDIVARIVALNKLQKDADFKRAKYVIVLNRPRWGGGKRMEGYIAAALEKLCKSPSEILVITTESSGTHAKDKFAPGIRVMDFSEAASRLGDSNKQRVLAEFLRSLRPDSVININSQTMWDTLGSYGPALRASFKLVNCMFCNEQTKEGFWTGYPVKRFYRTFDLSGSFGVDSDHLAQELIERHLIPDAQQNKIVVLSAPVDPNIPIAERPSENTDRRPQIFWSGRLDRQKRVDILYAIAAKCPEFDFRVWGDAFMDNDKTIPKQPENLTLEGMYDAVADLPLSDADAWLYTSSWDGVPSILLEISMTGVPLVGTRVGGTGEILRDGLTAPIDDVENIDAYCAALKKVIADPNAARKSALALREELLVSRSEDRYLESVRTLLNETDSSLEAS